MRLIPRFGLRRTDCPSHHRPAGRRLAARLRLEALEDRAVPAFGFGWAFAVGSTDFNCGQGIATDAQGNVYVSGVYSGTANFDPAGSPAGVRISAGGPDTGGGSPDNFVAKYSPAGAFQWVTDLGIGSNTYSRPRVAVSGGDVYAAYTAQGAGGQVITRAAQLDAALGGVAWTTTVATGSDTSQPAVAVGPSGGVYVTGKAAGSQAFVAKLDPTGAVLWTQAPAGGSSVGFGVAVDGSENVYVTGGYTGSVGFGGRTLTSLSGTEDAFVWKLDSTGATAWAGSMGNAGGGDEGHGISVDGAGNVVVTGAWGGSSPGVKNNDFDPGPGVVTLTYKGSTDLFVVKLAPGTGGSLQLAWAKSVGGSGSVTGTAVAVDGAGNVYATGFFDAAWSNKQGVDFDPGPGTFYLKSTGGANNDVFVLKLDTSGNFVTAADMGGNSRDEAYGIAVDGSGNVYTTGLFIGPADFDPTSGTYNLTSNGALDIFVSKLTQASPAMAAARTTATVVLPGAGSQPAASAVTDGPRVGTADGSNAFRPPAPPAALALPPSPSADVLPAWLGLAGPRRRPSALFADWLADAEADTV
jgi:hypothetical protein